MPARRVLFICLGNICRSPSAEGVFKRAANARGVGAQFVADSAGTGEWHIGNPPDARAQRAAKSRGIDIGDLRARKLVAKDGERFDALIVMDAQNLRDAKRIIRAAHHAKIRPLIKGDVPDPYYGDAADFDAMFDLLEAGCDALLAELLGESK